MMEAFCPDTKFSGTSVDFMKTKFRACPAPQTDSDFINSDKVREFLEALKGGDDEAKYGPIFKAIAQKDASMVCIFPFYRALSKQVHWFLVSRKALQHKNAIAKA